MPEHELTPGIPKADVYYYDASDSKCPFCGSDNTGLFNDFREYCGSCGKSYTIIDRHKIVIGKVRAENATLRARIGELEKNNKHLSTFLEEAAHAAATGKNPAKYLATEIPTELRDEIARLNTKNSMLRAKVKELETLLDPHAMTAAYMCGYEHGKNRCKCGGKLESHMEISGDEIKTYEQCDKCKGEVSK